MKIDDFCEILIENTHLRIATGGPAKSSRIPIFGVVSFVWCPDAGLHAIWSQTSGVWTLTQTIQNPSLFSMRIQQNLIENANLHHQKPRKTPKFHLNQSP